MTTILGHMSPNARASTTRPPQIVNFGANGLHIIPSFGAPGNVLFDSPRPCFGVETPRARGQVCVSWLTLAIDIHIVLRYGYVNVIRIRVLYTLFYHRKWMRAYCLALRPT